MSSSSNPSAGEKRALNIDSIDETLWLVKLPDFVGDHLTNFDHDDVIGKLKIRKVSGGKGKAPKKETTVKFKQSKEGTSSGELEIPTDFTLEDKNTSSNLSLVAFSGDGKELETFKLHGKITKNMNLIPFGPQYAKLLRDRNNKQNEKHVAKISNEELFKKDAVAGSDSQMINFKPSSAAIMRRQAKEANLANKGFQGEDDVTEVINNLRMKMFEAFSKADRIKQQDMHAYCHKVAGYTTARVKSLLDKYAKYHSKGTYKYFYELMPEYQGSAPPES